MPIRRAWVRFLLASLFLFIFFEASHVCVYFAGRDYPIVVVQVPSPDSLVTTVSENCALLAVFHMKLPHVEIAKDLVIRIIIYTSL
jgi:hypothetical protein